MPTLHQHPLFIVSGPSRAGKTRLVREMLRAIPTLRKYVTCTTRAPREDEVCDFDYHFLTREEFERGVKNREFAEWKENYGDLYGSRHRESITIARQETPVIVIIDPEGTNKLVEQHPDAHCIFVGAPIKDICERFAERDIGASLIRRELELKEELASVWHTNIYELVINNVNGKFTRAHNDLYMYLTALLE